MHPNIPPSGRWRALYDRLKMTFWTIIAPELIIACAVRQWFAAREIRDIYNKANGTLESKEWTMDHGFFLNMGGFMRISNDIHLLKEPERPDQKASGILKAAYLSRRRDYSERRANCKLGVLTIEPFKALIQDPDYEFPTITTSEIRDRSKGDALSKFIAIFQSTWFILHCIARGQQKLALTELELVTLALASLNAITYAFWWHKPLCVHEPMKIYFHRQLGDAAVLRKSHSEDESSVISAYSIISKVNGFALDTLTFLLKVIQNPCEEGLCVALTRIISIPAILLTLICLYLFLPFPLGIILLLKILKTQPVIEEPSSRRGLLAFRIVVSLQKLSYRLTSHITRVSEMWLTSLSKYDGPMSMDRLHMVWVYVLPSLFFILLATTCLFLPLFTFLFLISFIFKAAFGIITSTSLGTPGAKHVPLFYAPSTKSDKYSRMVVFAFFGVIFGGLHCIGWNFTFPTSFEQRLWRGASLAITVIPITVAPIDYVLENFELDEGWLNVVRLTLDFIMTVLLFTYVPARLSLIVQALALLRHQPDTAFLAVDWTIYLPHVF